MQFAKPNIGDTDNIKQKIVCVCVCVCVVLEYVEKKNSMDINNHYLV